MNRLPLTRFLLTLGLIGFAIIPVMYAEQEEAREPGQSPMEQKTIETVLQESTDSFMSLPGVVGTAQGECAGQPCIKVYVGEKTPELLEQLPTAIEGYPVVVEETGPIRALDPD